MQSLAHSECLAQGINCYYYSTYLPSILCSTWYIINCRGMFVSSFLGLSYIVGRMGWDMGIMIMEEEQASVEPRDPSLSEAAS